MNIHKKISIIHSVVTEFDRIKNELSDECKIAFAEFLKLHLQINPHHNWAKSDQGWVWCEGEKEPCSVLIVDSNYIKYSMHQEPPMRYYKVLKDKKVGYISNVAIHESYDISKGCGPLLTFHDEHEFEKQVEHKRKLKEIDDKMNKLQEEMEQLRRERLNV